MNRDMGILELALVLARRKTLIIVLTAVFAMSSIVFALLTPKYWTSTAVILPVTDSNSIGGFSTDLLGVFSGGLVKTQKSELAVQFISIMQSRTFREKVIQEFDLLRYFELGSLPADEALETALKRLQKKIVAIRFDTESELVSINVETKDKEMSRKMADYYLSELQTYLSETKLSKSKMQREFLESRVKEYRFKIDSLAVAIKDFQKQNKAIALDQQTLSLISLYSESIGKYFASEIEYELAKNQFSEGSPLLTESETKMKILGAKIKDLENSNNSILPDYVIQIDRIPDLGLRYAQLRLNAEILKKVFEYIYPQYEIARLEELRNMPAYEIIDKPVLSGVRSRPKRAIIVVSSTVAGFLLACTLALFWQNVIVANPEKIKLIMDALWGKTK